MIKYPLIEVLSESSIVDFDILNKKRKRKIKITDGCDGYFSRTFDKASFGELIKELQQLHGEMAE